MLDEIIYELVGARCVRVVPFVFAVWEFPLYTCTLAIAKIVLQLKLCHDAPVLHASAVHSGMPYLSTLPYPTDYHYVFGPLWTRNK